MAGIPESSAGITVGWMQKVLGAGHPSGVPRLRNVVVEDIGAGRGHAAEVLLCRLVYDGRAEDGPESVIVKRPSSSTKVRRLCRNLSLYKREYDFYRSVAGQIPLRSPALLYGDFDERSHDFVLVLEHLDGMEGRDQIAGASEAEVGLAIRSVAELHGRYWDRVDEPPLADFFDGGHRKWHRLAQIGCALTLASTFDFYGDLFSDRMRRVTEAWVVRAADQITEVAAGPRTLIHGDYRLDNMLFGANDCTDLAVLDWQGAAILNGLSDVAYFMSTSVSTDMRRRIERDVLAEYHDIVCRLGAKNFPFEKCWCLYRQSMLACLGIVALSGRLVGDHARSRRLGETLVQRVLAAVEDLDAEEFLPERRRVPSSAHAFSLLTEYIYRFSRAYRRIR